MQGCLENEVVVVTGAASGIGRALVLHALNEGRYVLAADISATALSRLKTDHTANLARLSTYQVDVACHEQMQAFASHVFCHYRAVSLLFNNAGVMSIGRCWEMSITEWRRSIDVNVMGVVNGIHHFVPRMLEQGSPGRVVNTASIGGLVPGGPYMGSYQGTKHMVAALTESLERELKGQEAPVSVSLVCPAAVATDINQGTDGKAQEDPETREALFRGKLSELVARGTSPEALAAEVFQGIREGRFWIIPPGVSEERLRLRCEDSISGR